jgi:hypothetical protein
MSPTTAAVARALRAPALALACGAVLLAGAPADAPAAIPYAVPALKKGDKAGICIAQTVKKGKLVALRQSVYRYRYVRITKGRNKGRFRRRIVQVSVQVKTSCLTQCVQLRKKGKSMQPTYRVRRMWVREPRRGKLVKVKRLRRVWLLGPCASLPSIEKLGAPVTITLLPGSLMTFDFSAFKREAPLSGTLHGYVPGKILDEADNHVILTSGTLDVGKTTMFTDKVCGGQVSDSIRTGEPGRLKLDPGRQSALTLGKNGTVNLLSYMVLDLPFELRNGDDGCGKPYLTTGYSTANETMRLSGSIGRSGLAQVPLKMPAADFDLLGCLSPGFSNQPCNGFEIPLPATLTMGISVSIVAKDP